MAEFCILPCTFRKKKREIKSTNPTKQPEINDHPEINDPEGNIRYRIVYALGWASLVVRMVNNLSARQETWVPVPGSGRALEKGNGYPLQYSCLENHRDRGAWQGYSSWVAKSWIQLSCIGLLDLYNWNLGYESFISSASFSGLAEALGKMRGGPRLMVGNLWSLRLSAAAPVKGLVVSGSALDNHISGYQISYFFFFLRNCTPDFRRGGTEMYMEHIEKVVVSM